jgi:hypothetical protein
MTTASQALPTIARILVVGPDSNELVATAQQKKVVSFAGLKQDGFILQQIELDGDPAIVVGEDGARRVRPTDRRWAAVPPRNELIGRAALCRSDCCWIF